MDLKHTEDFYIRSLLNKVKLKDIMVQKVITIDVHEPFSQVEKKLIRYRIRHLPVIENNDKLVGIITQRDLYRIQSPRRLESGDWFYDKETLDKYILKSVMTPNPFTLGTDNTVAEALLAMVDYKYGCIPIVEKDNLLRGIITQVDILRIGAQILREK